MDIPGMIDVDSMIRTINESNNFDKGFASVLYKQISKEVQSFENTLDEEHEVGVRLVSFGQSIQFHVSTIEYKNPYIFIFKGFLDNGSPVELIQHVSQLSFLLVKVKRLKPEEPKRPIGFVS